MNTNWIFSGIFLLIGLFSFAASIFNWDFFFNARRSKWLVNIIGRNGTRFFYSILGITLMIVGLLSFVGKVDLVSGF